MMGSPVPGNRSWCAVTAIVAQAGEVGLIGLHDHELMGIGSAVGTDRHGFAPADEFGAAFTKALPTPAYCLR